METPSPGSVLPAGTAHGQTITDFSQTVAERITAGESAGQYYVFDELPPRLISPGWMRYTPGTE